MGNSIRRHQYYALTLVVVAVGLFFVEQEIQNAGVIMMLHIGAILALGVYVRLHYHASRTFVLSSFFQIYSFAALLFSATQVSNGAYMFEIGEEGDANGIVWVLLLFFIVGFEFSAVAYRHTRNSFCLPRVSRFSDSVTTIVVLAASGIALAAALFVLIRYSGPVAMGIDRVTFWRTVVPETFGFVPTLVIQTFYFAAFFYLWRRMRGQGIGFATALVVLYIFAAVFALGQKFSAFMIYTSVWLMLLAGLHPQFSFKRRYYALVATLVLLILMGVVVSYSMDDRDAFFILERTALQAQVLWSVFHENSLPLLPSGNWACYFACDEFSDGKDYISYLYLPYGVYDFYSSGGTQLSGWMPALPIATFGLVIALGIHAVVSATLGYLQAKVICYLRNQDLVFSFLLFKMQLGLTFIWYASMTSAFIGLVFVSVVMIVYRSLLSLPRGGVRAWPNVVPFDRGQM